MDGDNSNVRRLPMQEDEFVRILFDNAQRAEGESHDELAGRVFRRLQLRHAQLGQLEQLTRSHLVHADLTADASPVRLKMAAGVGEVESADSPTSLLHEGGSSAAAAALRAYHLAVTDLFVEKALSFLENEAETYRTKGIQANTIALYVFLGGVVAAFVYVLLPTDKHPTWPSLASTFIRSFTAYGMLVILAVGLRRYGRAMLDQGERLFERRHALRQGRLFVHLNDGFLTISEMEAAFNWNAVGSNAFSQMQTEDSAPFGAAFKEFVRQFPNLVKAGMQAIGRSGGRDEEDAGVVK